ncbi:uncharacterized protein LOC144926757 [Branchiostoma floridae x Branchiostoma belcheri]
MAFVKVLVTSLVILGLVSCEVSASRGRLNTRSGRFRGSSSSRRYRSRGQSSRTHGAFPDGPLDVVSGAHLETRTPNSQPSVGVGANREDVESHNPAEREASYLTSYKRWHYYKVPVSGAMTSTNVKTTCEAAGYVTPCPGDSDCRYASSSCVFTGLEDCIRPMKELSQVLCGIDSSPETCDQLDGVYQFMNWRNDNSCGMESGDWCVFGSERQDRYALCARDGDVKGAAPDDTTSVPQDTTKRPPKAPSNCCGNILRQATELVDQSTDERVPDGWTLCYIDGRDTDYLTTRCRDLLYGIPEYGNARNLLAGGGNFGCWHGNTGNSPGPAYASNDVIEKSCRDDIQHSTRLSSWISSRQNTTLGVCIKGITCEMSATTVAPVGTTTTSHETTVASDRELKREASYLATYKGWHYYKVPVSGAMTSANVKTTCEAAGYVTPCPGDSDCRYSSSSCNFTGLEDCSGPMNDISKALCGAKSPPNMCSQLYGVYQFMTSWRSNDDACGAESGSWCVSDASWLMDRYAFCARDRNLTTVATPEATTSPPRTKVSRNCCGNILRQATGLIYQTTDYKVPEGWTLCYIDKRDTNHYETPCRDLLQGIPQYGNAERLLAAGGNFGCWHGYTGLSRGPAYASNNVIQRSCREDIQQGTRLSSWSRHEDTTLGVCIKGITCETSATTVAPVETTTASHDTVTTPEATTSPPRTQVSRNCCGNILRQATELVDQTTGYKVPEGWTLCYVDGRDTDHYGTPCQDLLQGIPQYGDAQQLLAAGGNFGCWHGNTGVFPGPAYASNNVIQKSCRDGIQHPNKLSGWAPETATFSVCIRGITCETNATTVAPMETTTASYDTTVASDQESKREASYLATYKGWHYYKVPVSGAMTSTNVKTTCEAAGYVTPCPGDDCQYSSSSCVSTGLGGCLVPMNDVAQVLCDTGPAGCAQFDGVYQFMDHWRSDGDACGVEAGDHCTAGSEHQDRYAFCARDKNVTAVASLGTITTSHDTTVVTPEATTSPPHNKGSRNCCGNILRQATELVDQTTDHKVPEGWIMCYIDERDTDHLYTPCRDLLQGIPQYGNAERLLEAGGNFGCWHGYEGDSPGPAYAANNVIEKSCRDGIQHYSKLSGWTSETAILGVCIRGITCETTATTVAPMETTTASHDTTVASEQESKREASYLASYKGWHYYKVPVSGAMTSANVKTTCEAAGYVTPCPGDRDCRYSSSSCVSTGLEDCIRPMNDVSHVLCGSNSTPHTCGQLDGVYQYMNNWKSGDASCGAESGRWCVEGSEQEDRYAFCARDKNVTAVTTLGTVTTSHDTTVATPEVTTSPLRTKVSRNCCGNILRQATELVDQTTGYKVPEGWTLCYVDGRDTDHYGTPCQDLLQGIPQYGDAQQLLAAGGNFGCWHGNSGVFPGPAYASNNVIQKSCRDGIQHPNKLSGWAPETATFSVCIRGITCETNATTVAPMETTTASHDTTVASEQESKREASYLASYKGWHYYKVPVSGAMTSTNVKTTCEAAGYVTPCPGDSDCRYSSSSCVSTGLEDCSRPMNDVSHVLCGSKSTPHTCGQLDGVYQYMNNWKSGDASCGVESGRWCVEGSEQEDRYAFCARDKNVTAVTTLGTTTTSHDTTVATPEVLVTTSPPRTNVSRNCCGNILRQATELVDQTTDHKVPEGWTLCYVDGRDTDHYGTPCRGLLQGIPQYGNAEQLLAAGENFGCWHGNTGLSPGPAYASNNVIQKSCRDGIQHSSKLSGWTPKTSTFGVCIRGITCVSITCNNDYMELAISKEELTGIDQNNLHWEPDQNCGATTNGTHYLFRTDLYGCGTKATFDPKYVVFKNTINIGSVHEANSVISREGDIRITSKCKYERQQWVDSTFQPIPGLHGLNITEEGFGQLEVRLSMFPTRQYQTPYFADQYPIHLRPRQRTYLQLEAKGHGKKLSVLALNCKATMSPKPNDPLQYQLIKEGCASDPTLDIYREDSEDPTKERFGFEAFRFIQEVKMVYVHSSSSLRSRRGAPWALLAAGGGLMALALVVLGAAVVRKHSRREEWAYQGLADVEGEE